MTDSGAVVKATKRCFDWLEIKQHDKQEDCWLVLEGKVYNVTRWAHHHPGGRLILSYHAGRDATEFFNAFHKDKDYTRKFLKPLYIGDAEEYQQSDLVKDFATLRKTAEEMGLFMPSFKYYSLMLLHVLLLEITAYLVLLIFGTWWLPFSISALLQSIYVMQGSWLQHDFGHGSPCKSRSWKKVFHYISGSLIMGMSPRWWNDLHFRHHAKPNVIIKDPDLNLGPFYVQGNVMAIEGKTSDILMRCAGKHLAHGYNRVPLAAHDWKNPFPFNKQHLYFFLVGPPLLFSFFMQLGSIVFMIVNKCWLDLLMGSLFFLRYYYLYEPLLGFRWMLIMFACMRCIQSHWFTFVGLSNHVPMPIGHDESRSWFRHQVESTVNIEQSMFNHWFTGGLNSHIEHHLFPTMPRHNFHKITPLVKTLCDKHHIKYTVKPFSEAVLGLIRSLKSYGALWKKTKDELHVE